MAKNQKELDEAARRQDRADEREFNRDLEEFFDLAFEMGELDFAERCFESARGMDGEIEEDFW